MSRSGGQPNAEPPSFQLASKLGTQFIDPEGMKDECIFPNSGVELWTYGLVARLADHKATGLQDSHYTETVVVEIKHSIQYV